MDRIEQLNPTLNAIVFFVDNPLEQARQAEAAVMRGDDLGLSTVCPIRLSPNPPKGCAGEGQTGGKTVGREIAGLDSDKYGLLSGVAITDRGFLKARSASGGEIGGQAAARDKRWLTCAGWRGD